MENYKFSRRLVFSFGVIFLITGVAKVLSSWGDSKILATPDPIVGIAFSSLMLAAGLFELVVAFVCCWCYFLNKETKLVEFLVAWLSTMFLGYRFGIWWMHWNRPCICLGNLTDAIHISPQIADDILRVVLAYLIIGSYGLLFWRWKNIRRYEVVAPKNPML